MIAFKTITTEVEKKIPVSITCDSCKKKYYYGKMEDDYEIHEFHHIRFTGGFGSIFGDMNEMKGDICQHCLQDKFGECLVVERDLMDEYEDNDES